VGEAMTDHTEFVDTDAAPGSIPLAFDDGAIPRLAACDQCARAVWQVRSTHRTSAGAVGYARCPCGAWLVLLNGRPLATAHLRPRAATPPVPGERQPGRHRLRTAPPADPRPRLLPGPNGGPS